MSSTSNNQLTPVVDPTVAGPFGLQRIQTATSLTLRGLDITLDDNFFRGVEEVLIEADTLRIPRDFKVKLPGGRVTLLARSLIAAGTVRIDVSGENGRGSSSAAANGREGTDQEDGQSGADGKAGEHGQNGGEVTIAVETMADSDPGVQFQLLARGGNGGDGQEGGKGGRGQTGANGKDWNWDGREGAATNGEAGSNGKAGGKGGNGGNAGLGGLIAFCVVKPFSTQALAETANESGVAGKGAAGGAGGQAGEGGWGGLSGSTIEANQPDATFVSVRYPARARTRPTPESWKKRFDVPRPATRSMSGFPSAPRKFRVMGVGEWGWDGANGAAGVDGLAAGKPPAIRGSLGTGNDRYPNFIGEFQETEGIYEGIRCNAALSLEYRFLILRNIKLFFLRGTDAGFEMAARLVEWLAQVTPAEEFFQRLARGDFGVPVTARAESFRLRMLAAEANCLAILDELRVIAMQLAAGLDYFGQPRDWVPLLPLDSYQTYGQAIADAAKATEQMFDSYEKKIATAAEFARQGADTADQLRQRQSALEERLQTVLVERRTSDEASQSRLAEITSREKALVETGEKFIAALRVSLKTQKTSAMFDIIRSVAVTAVSLTTVGPAVKAGGAFRVAAASALSKLQGVRPAGPEDENEAALRQVANTNQVVNLDKATRAASSLFSDVKNIIDKAGEINELTRRSDRARTDYGVDRDTLKLDREQFKKRLLAVGDDVPDAEKENYWKSFDQYLTTVEAYATAYGAYRGTYITEAQLSAEHRRNAAQLQTIESSIRQKLPLDQPGYREALLDLYFNSKVALQDFLYEQRQAYRYWALEEPKAAPALLDNVAAAVAQSADLTGQLIRRLNRSIEVPQPFDGMVLTLTAAAFPEQFAALKAGETAWFPLGKTTQGLAENFAGKANIRIEKVQVHFPGLRNTDGKVFVECEHAGHSTFIDRQRKEWQFSHLPSRIIYEYESRFVPASKAPMRGPGQFTYDVPEELSTVDTLGRYLGLSERRVEVVSGITGGVVGNGKTRILPAILATWAIRVPAPPRERNNLDLDLRRIDRMVLVFSGQTEAYSPQQSQRWLTVDA